MYINIYMQLVIRTLFVRIASTCKEGPLLSNCKWDNNKKSVISGMQLELLCHGVGFSLDWVLAKAKARGVDYHVLEIELCDRGILVVWISQIRRLLFDYQTETVETQSDRVSFISLHGHKITIQVILTAVGLPQSWSCLVKAQYLKEVEGWGSILISYYHVVKVYQ